MNPEQLEAFERLMGLNQPVGDWDGMHEEGEDMGQDGLAGC